MLKMTGILAAFSLLAFEASAETLHMHAMAYVAKCEKKNGVLSCDTAGGTAVPVAFELNNCNTQEEMKEVCRGQELMLPSRDGLSFRAQLTAARHGLNRGNVYDLHVQMSKAGSSSEMTTEFHVDLDEQGNLNHRMQLEGPLYRALYNTYYRLVVVLAPMEHC